MVTGKWQGLSSQRFEAKFLKTLFIHIVIVSRDVFIFTFCNISFIVSAGKKWGVVQLQPIEKVKVPFYFANYAPPLRGKAWGSEHGGIYHQLPWDRPFPPEVFFLFLDATVKVPFLKKCKEAGLLDDLFEEILDKLHLIQDRLMDERTSESGTEIAVFLSI